MSAYVCDHRLQWKIINSVLNDKRDNCVIMATGEPNLLISRFGKYSCCQPNILYTKKLLKTNVAEILASNS